MRIAFCLFKYFPHGGLQRDLLDLAVFRQRAGDEVYVYAMEWRGARPAGLVIRTVGVHGFSNHSRCKRYHRRVAALIPRDGIEMVVGFDRMPGLDIYVGADSSYLAKGHDFLRRLSGRYRHFKKFEGAVFGRSSHTHIVALAEKQQQEYQQVWGTPSERFTLLPPGISRSACAPAADIAQEWRRRIRAEFGIRDEHLLLLLIASAFKTKGLDRAINALHALPPDLKPKCRLLVVGSDKASRYKKMAHSLALHEHVIFAGGRDDIPTIMQAGDLLIHPAHIETTGKTILEAIVSGLPLIVTDVCGFAYHVHQADAGMTVPSPFNQEDFNRQLAAMLQSPRHAQWRKNGITYGQTQDLYSMTEAASATIDQHRPKARQSP